MAAVNHCTQARSDSYPLNLDNPCEAEPEPRDKQFGKFFQQQ